MSKLFYSFQEKCEKNTHILGEAGKIMVKVKVIIPPPWLKIISVLKIKVPAIKVPAINDPIVAALTIVDLIVNDLTISPGACITKNTWTTVSQKTFSIDIYTYLLKSTGIYIHSLYISIDIYRD